MRFPRLAPLLLAAAFVPARADERFEALRQKAEAVGSLASFAERYVGVCKDPLERVACQANVRQGRKALEGRLFAAVLAERARELIRVERRARGFRFLVTPFVDADGLAVTHGEPRLDARGRPTIPFIVVDAPAGVDEAMIDAALRTGRVEMEILFRAEGAWKLKRRGEDGFYEGVKARFAALRLVDGRTGAEIAAKVL